MSTVCVPIRILKGHCVVYWEVKTLILCTYGKQENTYLSECKISLV
jgi:hypothetical protein